MKKHATTRKGRIGGLRIASVIALVLLVMVCAISCPEPNNTPKGNATLYITGNYMTADSADPPNYTQHIGYWVVNKNGSSSWNRISIDPTAETTDLVVSNNTVYISGHINDQSTNIQTAGYWKIENSNTTSPQWKALQKIDDTKYSYIIAITIVDNTLYAIGSSINSNDDPIYGYWTVDLDTGDESWIQLTPPAGTSTVHMDCLAASSDTLYIGANISDASYVSQPGYWDVNINTSTGTWKDLPILDSSQPGHIDKLAVSGNTVYATGYSVDDQNHYVAMYWKVVGSGTPEKVSLTDSATTQWSEATGVAISGNTVYTVGTYEGADQKQYTCYWTINSSGNMDMEDLPVYQHANPVDIAQKDGMLYIAGSNYNGTDTIPGYWIVDTTKNSKTWVSLSTDSGDVTSMFLVP